MASDFTNSITGQTPPQTHQILLHPCLSGGLFEMSVMGHFKRQSSFALLFTRSAWAAACAHGPVRSSKISPPRIKGFPILVVTLIGEHDRRQVLGMNGRFARYGFGDAGLLAGPAEVLFASLL
jgi:hypothetical protein